MAELPDLSVVTNRVGPLPVWAWAAIGGTVIGLGIRAFRRPAPAPDTGGVEYAPIGAVLPAGGGGIASGPITEPGPETNAEWRARAVRLLAARGYAATQADAAIARWLAGETLTATERAIVDEAVPIIGPPPEYVAPPPAIAPGPPEPGPERVSLGLALGMLLPGNAAGRGDFLDRYRQGAVIVTDETTGQLVSHDEFVARYINRPEQHSLGVALGMLLPGNQPGRGEFLSRYREGRIQIVDENTGALVPYEQFVERYINPQPA